MKKKPEKKRKLEDEESIADRMKAKGRKPKSSLAVGRDLRMARKMFGR